MKKILMILVSAFLFSCSDSDSVNISGTIIETNTGHKNMARLFVSTAALELQAGDTLVATQMERDTIDDLIYVYKYSAKKVVLPLDVTAGIIMMDSVPVGKYDSVYVYSESGDIRTVAVEWNVMEDEINFDEALEISDGGVKSIVLPEEFSDLSNVDESFNNVPLALVLPKEMENPCLMDRQGEMILLDSTYADSTFITYWGVMPQVIFSDSGTIDFDIILGCQESKDLNLTLGRYAEHFDESSPSEAALVSNSEITSLYGKARWTDSTDNWFLINDFKPFEDRYSMAASIWINMKKEQQPETYMRILSAKKDSTGFIIQQRADRSAVNLRLDAGSGEAYNQIFGTADILDGTWHNYAFRISKDSVAIFADGVLIQKEVIISGSDFSAAFNPAVGAADPNLIGGLDEVFFFDGSQSDNWMRLFYALQKVNSM